MAGRFGPAGAQLAHGPHQDFAQSLAAVDVGQEFVVLALQLPVYHPELRQRVLAQVRVIVQLAQGILDQRHELRVGHLLACGPGAFLVPG